MDNRQRPSNVLDQNHVKKITEFIKEIFRERASVDYSVAENVVQDLNKCFENRNIKNVKAKCYGSYFSELALTTSNINIELETEGPYKNNLNEIHKHIARELCNYEVTYEEKTAKSGSKICLTEPINGVACELVNSSKKTSRNFARMLLNLCNYDARVRPLLIALRVWAEVCDIHEAENGRLHPLCYMLMVIHFLQQCRPQVLPLVDRMKIELYKVRRSNTSLGELWLRLLKYYSEFNWAENFISILKPKDVKKPEGAAFMIIEDPFIPGRNIAKSVISEAIKKFIQSCFQHSYEHFSQPLTNELDSGIGDDTGILHSNEYKYSFKFLSLNLDYPETCGICEELGTTCKACKEDPIINVEKIQVSTRFRRVVDKSLHDVYNKYKLSESKIDERKAFVEDLEKYVRLRFPGAKLDLFGSSMNGFGFEDSDLDICMTIKGKSEKDIDVKLILRRLCTHLRRKDKALDIFVLYYAQIPIIKFNHQDLKFKGDISLYNQLAVHNTNLLHTYSLIDERAKVLGSALKLLAKKGDISDSAQKSLSSYSYILMVIHFLQQTSPPILPVLQQLYDKNKQMPKEMVDGCNVWFYKDLKNLKRVWSPEENSKSAGQLWLECLSYYANKIGSKDFIVSIRRKELLDKDSSMQTARLLNIEDPFLLKRNLGCVISEEMAVKTHQTLLRARNLFGKPILECPNHSWEEYFFNQTNLTGRVSRSQETEHMRLPDQMSNKVPMPLKYQNGVQMKPQITRNCFQINQIQKILKS